MQSNVYATWTGPLTDPATGEPRQGTIRSRVIDAELRTAPANLHTIAAWAVWAATPTWITDSPDCEITPTTPPAIVEIHHTDHPAQTTAHDVLAQTTAGLTDQDTGLPHGHTWDDDPGAFS